MSNETRATKYKRSGEYLSIVLRDPVAIKSLERLVKTYGTKTAAVEAALANMKAASKK